MAREHYEPIDGDTGSVAIDLDRVARLRRESIRVPVERGSLGVERLRIAGGTGRRGAVLTVHGYGQNRRAFHLPRRSMTAFLAAEGFDVFAADLRGVASSRALGSRPARGFLDYVDRDLPALVAAAREASGEDRIFLVGHSLGAAVCYAYAGRRPERVRGVATLAGVYDFGRRNPVLRTLGRVTRLLDLAPWLAGRIPGSFPLDRIGRGLVAARRHVDSPAFARRNVLQAWHPGAMEDGMIVDCVGLTFEPASIGLTLDLARRARGGAFLDDHGGDLLATFAALEDVPLLVIAGREDVLVCPEDARPAYDLSRSRDRTWLCVDRSHGGVGWGHVDLLSGTHAPRHVWPVVRDWLASR